MVLLWDCWALSEVYLLLSVILVHVVIIRFQRGVYWTAWSLWRLQFVLRPSVSTLFLSTRVDNSTTCAPLYKPYPPKWSYGWINTFSERFWIKTEMMTLVKVLDSLLVRWDSWPERGELRWHVSRGLLVLECSVLVSVTRTVKLRHIPALFALWSEDENSTGSK